MLGGDLVGEFNDFLDAAKPNWRRGPINIMKGFDLKEPFAMVGIRLMQFPRSGNERLQDADLLERNLKDYEGLKKEVASNDPVWDAVRAVVAFLRKVRGPSGCSELLVLSRIMRKEIVTLQRLNQITPWVKDQDRNDLVNALKRAEAWDAFRSKGFNSNLFQFVVTDGYYADLAMNNSVHFSPGNWTKFEVTHSDALQHVDNLVSAAPSIEYAPIPADAVAKTAYCLHFLSDAFSAGHMRVPRAALGRSGSLLAGVMHNFDGQLGLVVENQFNDRWLAFGDGYLQDHTDLQQKRLQTIRPVLMDNGRANANMEFAVAAMGSAMKQLHYQAQSHFGDTANSADFQPMLAAARGTNERLQYDDILIDAYPGDPRNQAATLGSQWISLRRFSTCESTALFP